LCTEKKGKAIPPSLLDETSQETRGKEKKKEKMTEEKEKEAKA